MFQSSGPYLLFIGLMAVVAIISIVLKQFKNTSRNTPDFQPTMGPWDNVVVPEDVKAVQKQIRLQYGFPAFQTKGDISLWLLEKHKDLEYNNVSLKNLVDEMLRSGAYPVNQQVLLSLELLQLTKTSDNKAVAPGFNGQSPLFKQSKSKKSWHIELDLPTDCTFEEIKEKYRTEIKKVHPDVSTEPDIEKARKLNRIYKEAKAYYAQQQ